MRKKVFTIFLNFILLSLITFGFAYHASAGLGGSVYGLVYDATTNKPLSGATVVVHTGYGPYELKTFSNGYYSIFVPEGYDYIIEVDCPGYEKGKQTGIRVNANDYTEVNIGLLPIAKTSRGDRIALKSLNGNYVCADMGLSGAMLVADRSNIGEWEIFELIGLPNNKFALKASNGKFVCADQGMGSVLYANREQIGEWETFEMVNLGGSKIAIKTIYNKYVCADYGRGNKLIADRDNRGEWEVFELVYIK